MKFLIYSFEHSAWWKPNAHGYTKVLSEAGIYSLERAVDICALANCLDDSVKIEEAMVPITGQMASLIEQCT